MHSVTLAQAVIRTDLLPTPTVVDMGNNKTPEEWEAWKAEQRAKHGNGNGHGESLAQVLLPTTRVSMSHGPTRKEIAEGNPKTRLETEVMLGEISWGKFQPAIRRWEAVLGRPAPAPTKPDGKDGAHRLSSLFTEWMMGLPEGWITDAEVGRVAELKMAGNGVVPQQAELALKTLLKGIKL